MQAQQRVAKAPLLLRRVVDRRSPRCGQCCLSWVVLVAPGQVSRRQGRPCASHRQIVGRSQPHANAAQSTQQMLRPSQKRQRSGAGQVFDTPVEAAAFPGRARRMRALPELRQPGWQNPAPCGLSPIHAQTHASAVSDARAGTERATGPGPLRSTAIWPMSAAWVGRSCCVRSRC